MAEHIIDGVRFRPIPGFNKYDVGEDGTVISWCTTGHKNQRASKPKFISQKPNSKGYLRVALIKDGIRSDKKVANLVLLAFVGPCPTGREACHWNGNKSNNNLSNLRWGTSEENAEDRLRQGRMRFGPNKQMILTIEIIKFVKLRLSQEACPKVIAQETKMNRSSISRIKSGESWKNI